MNKRRVRSIMTVMSLYLDVSNEMCSSLSQQARVLHHLVRVGRAHHALRARHHALHGARRDRRRCARLTVCYGTFTNMHRCTQT